MMSRQDRVCLRQVKINRKSKTNMADHSVEESSNEQGRMDPESSEESKNMDVVQEVATTAGLFKKRNKGNLNIRKKPATAANDSNSNENEAGDEINREALQECQSYHSSKIKSKGVTLETLVKGSQDKDKTSATEQTAIVNTVLGAFSVHVDNGLQPAIPHAHIMEKYINEKLHVPAEVSTTSDKVKKPRLDEELYQIPANLEVDPLHIPGVHNPISKVKMEEDGVVSSWSTGIAEVALPISYKLKNIEATEVATKSKTVQEEELRLMRQSMPYSSGGSRSSGYGKYDHLTAKSGNGYQRFQIVDRSIPKQLFDYSLSQFVSNDTSLQQSLIDSNEATEDSKQLKEQQQQQHKPRFMHSTDDMVMDKYRKVRVFLFVVSNDLSLTTLFHSVSSPISSNELVGFKISYQLGNRTNVVINVLDVVVSVLFKYGNKARNYFFS